MAALSTACSVAPGDGATSFGGTGGEGTGTAPSSTDPGSSSGGSEAGSAPVSETEVGGTSTSSPPDDTTDPGSESTFGDSSTGPVIPPDDSSSDGGVTTSLSDDGTSSDGGFGTSTDDGGGETAAPKGFPDAAATCTSGALDEYFPAALGDPELIVLGVYQPTGTDIAVEIDRAGPAIILVLSSYEPVHWVLDIAAGTDVTEVILNGYESQTVEGEGAATVTDRSGIGNYLEACGYAYPGEDGGCDTDQLVAAAEDLTGTTLALFAGCYEASSFTVD